MRYHNITKEDMLNGEGLRVVLWLAGCTHYCPGCHNPITWDPNGGLPFTEAEEEEIKKELAKPYIDGLTLSGGDPLYEANHEELTAMVQRLKEAFPQKTIWLYTGYLWEEVKDLPLMQWIDVVVDGPFIEAEKDVQLPWRGSRNQRLIDVKTETDKC